MRPSGVETWCGCVCVCVCLHLLSIHYRSAPSVQLWSYPGRDTMLMRSTQVTGESSTAGRWQIPTQTLTDLWQHWRQWTSKHTSPVCLLKTVYKHTHWHVADENTAGIKAQMLHTSQWHAKTEILTAWWHICQLFKVNIHFTHTHANCTPFSCLSSLLFKKTTHILTNNPKWTNQKQCSHYHKSCFQNAVLI